MAPNPVSPRHHLKSLSVILVCMITLFSAWKVDAANVTWSSAGTSSAGGNGNWTGGSTWWNGTSGVAWTTGDNATFSAAGNTTVNSNVTAGTLTISSSTANISILAGAGNLTVNTGITVTNSANTTALAHTMGANLVLGGTLALSVANGGSVGTSNLILSGNLSGGNGITKSGNGTLTLSGVNTYTGQSRLDNGNTIISTIGNFTESSSLGQGTAGTSIRMGSTTTSGTLVYTGNGNTSNRTIQIGNGNGTGGTTAATITSNGTGALIFTASGFNTADTSSVSGFSNRTLTLRGVNTGNNEIQGAIVNNTNGTVALTKNDAGRWIISGNNSYTGATTISAGTLQIGNGGSTGSLSTGSAITNNAALVFNRTDTVTQGTDFAAVISGTGATIQNGTGTLVLNGANTFTGALSVQTGTLSISAINNASTTGALGNSATAVTLGSSGSTGTLLYTGATGSSSKRLTLATGGNGTINVSDSSANLTLSGIIDGSGALTKNGTGILILTGTNTFSGGFSLNQGQLQIGNTGNGTTSGSLGTGAITLNGGTLASSSATARTINNAATIGGDVILGNATNTGALTFAGNVNLGGSTRIVTLDSAATFGGEVSNGGLTKNGTGTLTLTANNTYTGMTTINSGTLGLGGSGTNTIGGNITIAGGQLIYSNTSNSQISDASNVTLESGTFNVTGRTETINSLNMSGGVLTAIGLANLTLSSNSSFTGGTVNMGSGSSGVINTSGTTTLGNVTFDYNHTSASGTSTGLLLGGNLTVNDNSTANFTNANATNRGSVRVNAVMGATTVMTVGNNSTLNMGWNLIFSNATTTLTKEGNGTLVISGSGSGIGNGTTLINTGNVTLTGGNATGDAQRFNFGNATGAVLYVAESEQLGIISSLGTNSGNIIIAENQILTTTYTATGSTFNGTISGNNAGLTKTQLAGTNGTLTLTGNNTYTGATTVAAGTLALSGAGALSDSTAVNVTAGSFTINAITSTGETIGSLAGAAGTTVVLGNKTLTTANNDSTTFAGVISGTGGGLTKNGTGTLTLNGSNTYTGATTISAGTLQIGNGGLVGSLSTSSVIANNANLVFNRTNDVVQGTDFSASAITGTGNLTQSGSGNLTLNAANTYTGTTAITSGTLQIGDNGATGSLSASSAIENNGALVFRRNNAISQGTDFSTAAITGIGMLIQNSSSSITLNNSANSFSGGVWVQQGTLYAAAIGNSSASSYLGSCGTIKLGSSSNTGTLRLTTGSPIETTDKVIDLCGTTGGGSIIAANATITMTGNLAMSGTGNKNLSFTSSGSTNTFNLTYSGLISEGVGSVLSLSFAGSGNGNHTLANANNSFSGAVSIAGNTAGTTTTLNVAAIGNAGANSYLGKNSAINIGAGTGGTNILKYTGTGETTDKVINLASTANANQASLDASNASGLLKFTNDFTATGTASSKILNLIGSGNAEIAGVIVNNTSGNVTNVTKSGAGTWTLSGNNTYTGATTISAGTLVLNGTNSGSAITVNSGGTLAGSGTGGATIVNSGGKIGPGNSPGILTVGDLTLNSGGIYTWEMADATGFAGTGWDQLNANGLLTIGSNATSTFTIAITSSGAPTNWNYAATNQTWDILDYGTISGFNASYFTLNSSAFGGDLTPDSSWSLTDTGSALRLTYTYTQNTPTYAGATGIWSTGFTPAITNSANAIFFGAGGTATNDIASATLSSVGSLTFDGTNSYTLEANSGSAGNNSSSALAIGGTIVNNSSVVQTINLATSFAANQTINANTGGIVVGGNMAVASGATLTVVGSNNTTMSGVVSGLGGLTKNSSSTLTLSGNNTYSGNNTIGQGKVLIGDNNAFGTGSIKLGVSGVNATITIASTDSTARTISNTLDTFAGNSWITTFGEASGGTGNLSFTNTTGVSLGSTSRTFNVLNTTSLASGFSTLSGAIVKTGSGTLILTGASTYNGSTTINAGTLQLGNGGTSGSLSAGSAITNNGTLVFNRSNTMTQGIAFASTIGGTGNVIQAGTGTLVLSGANTYTGSTTVSAGNITISNVSALGGTGSGTTVANGAALQIQGDIAVGAEAINLTGSGFSNAGALRNLSGANSLAGAITLAGTTTIGSDAGTLTLTGGVSGTQNLTLTGAGNTTISGTIATSSGSLTKNGSGTATLSAANTYSGTTTVNSGTLVAAASNALGNTSQVILNNGGSFLVTADNAVNDSADITMAGGTLAFSGNRNETIGALTLSANSTLDFGTGSVVAIFSSLVMNGYALNIYNWTGTTLWNGGTGNNTDRFYVNSAVSASDLSRISFYSDSLQNSFVGNGYQILSGSFSNQIIPVPEPEAYVTAVILLIGGVIWARRHRRCKQARSA